ncbi:hypothetical protein Daus18300_010409 [Diaporthe australafricana]|uniref:Non-specific serine/threonine protein kinase n=1 Tax=Diaporthe australafricana TaxID=127596 RepID=A0ABR3WAP4_9PEZI
MFERFAYDETARKDGDGLPASQREAYESDEVPDAFVPRDWESNDDSDAFVPRSVDSGSEPRSMFQLEDLDKELGRWTPPEEPLRPENPYRKGKIVEIRKHTASMPFGQFYPNFEGERECAPERELRLKTLVELCVDRPPLEGKVIADEKAQTLEIVDEIRVKEDGGAQIVVCRFSGSEEQVVAKIYDPLYYGFANRMWSDQPRDVTYEAEKDYCREVAAYLELDDQFGGTDIPKYHGSWTFQLPIDLPDGQKTRDIRLILMEHIKGKPMTDLKPEDFPESVGLELVKRFVEVDCRIRFAGVTHGDVSQRNIMVCLTEPDIVERVALIDFNFAVVNRLDDFEQQTGRTRKPGPDKLPNPVNIWWGGGLYGFAGEWFPKRWDFRLRACQEWLYENYGTSEEYMPPKTPLNWDEENLPQRWIAY